MDKLTKIRCTPLPADSPYVKPFRMYYTQNGVEKNWDLLKVHDSVGIIVFNLTRNTLIFVKQFRPAVYYDAIFSDGCNDIEKIDFEKYPASLGITIELCAGIVDKSKPLIEIAKEEVLEECGYNVSIDRIEEVLTYRAGVGVSGALQKMYYCEVTDADKSNEGGGVDDEIIEVVEYSLDQAKQLVQQGAINQSPPSFLFGVLWFLTNKAPGRPGSENKSKI